MNDTFTITEIKNLYVIRLRSTEVQPLRPLSNSERLAGWREDDEKVVNSWHQCGSLHKRNGPYLLAWEVNPGEEVVASLIVEISKEINTSLSKKPMDWPENEPYFGICIVSAYCHPEVYSKHVVSEKSFLAKVTTVLGRGVLLGEDGAEDAFGHDAIRTQLEAAVYENDWRRMQCDLELVEFPNEEKEQESWEKELSERTVRVNQKPIDTK